MPPTSDTPGQPDPDQHSLCGGIDLGGTKIEARLFDGPEAQTVATKRWPTPLDDFDTLLAALVVAMGWLTGQAGQAILPIGLSIAGTIDPETGETFAANLPTTGHAVGPALSAASGRRVSVVNDGMAFAYSEAHGGVGAGMRSVMGLALGTGVGGGICIAGKPPYRHGGLAVEIGHTGLTAATLARHNLPPLPCGCGQSGCVETYVSGTGLANLSEQLLGRRRGSEDLANDPGPAAQGLLDIWADLAGDCLYAIQITLAPEVIALGGGLSNMPGCAERLTVSLSRRGLQAVARPLIRVAQFGDSSGARGAALIARDQNST